MKISVTDNVVTVTDQRKTVTFERDAHTEVDPLKAAKLYAEYITLLDTCPRAPKYAREAAEAPAEVSHTHRESKLSLKPKKITLRILEGERIV